MESVTETLYHVPQKYKFYFLLAKDAQSYTNTSVHLNANNQSRLFAFTSSGGSWSFLQDASDPFKLKKTIFTTTQ